MSNISRFADRAAGGRLLAGQVAAHLREAGRTEPPLVLALPRGGLPVAEEVHRALGGDLDIVVARKIGAPWQPELGVGAVAEDGPPFIDPRTLGFLGLTEGDLAKTIERERTEVRRRLGRYRQGRAAIPIAGRVCVVVDDGLATGVTARAALRFVRGKGPAYTVFAAPVCAPESAAALGDEADAIICVLQPPALHAIGLWYDDFKQLTDADVDRALRRQAGPATTGASAEV